MKNFFHLRNFRTYKLDLSRNELETVIGCLTIISRQWRHLPGNDDLLKLIEKLEAIAQTVES